MANNSFPPKREWGLSGYRDCRGGLEGMRDGGELSNQAECGATRPTTWVQFREGHRGINLGREAGAVVGRDRAQAYVPGFMERVEGV